MTTVRPILPSPESSSSSSTPAISQDASCPDGTTSSPASSVSPSSKDIPNVPSPPPSQSFPFPPKPQPFILPFTSLFPPKTGNQPPPLPPRQTRIPSTILYSLISLPLGSEDHIPKIAIVNRSYYISSIRREYRKKIDQKEQYAPTFYPTDDENTDDERGVVSRKQQEWFKRKMEKEEKAARGEHVYENSEDSEESEECEEEEEQDDYLLEQIEPIPFDESEASSSGKARDSSNQIANQRMSFSTADAQIDTTNPLLVHESESLDETTPLLLQPKETRKRKRDGGFGSELASKVATVLYSPIALFVDVCFGIDEEEEA